MAKEKRNKITTTEYVVIKPTQLLETDKYSEVYRVTNNRSMD
jgi:hypothetical protein